MTTPNGRTPATCIFQSISFGSAMLGVSLSLNSLYPRITEALRVGQLPPSREGHEPCRHQNSVLASAWASHLVDNDKTWRTADVEGSLCSLSSAGRAAGAEIEPPRVSRRFPSLRGWGHEDTRQLPPEVRVRA